MNLHKRLVLLNHLNNFIKDKISSGSSTDDVLAMIRYKSIKFREQEEHPDTRGARKTYLTNYVLILNKRVIDFDYFRKKTNFMHLSDTELFDIINFRDKIIYKKIYKN